MPPAGKQGTRICGRTAVRTFLDLLWLCWDHITLVEEVMRGLDDLVARAGQPRGLSEPPAGIASQRPAWRRWGGLRPFVTLGGWGTA
jgi:hypothetical protein